MLTDQAAFEPELRPDVVMNAVTSRERVVRQPVRASSLVTCLVLGKPDLQVLCSAGEHPPHRSRLLTTEICEHGIREAGSRRVAGGHRCAIELRKCRIETL